MPRKKGGAKKRRKETLRASVLGRRWWGKKKKLTKIASFHRVRTGKVGGPGRNICLGPGTWGEREVMGWVKGKNWKKKSAGQVPYEFSLGSPPG